MLVTHVAIEIGPVLHHVEVERNVGRHITGHNVLKESDVRSDEIGALRNEDLASNIEGNKIEFVSLTRDQNGQIYKSSVEILNVEVLHTAVMRCYHGNKDKQEMMLQIRKYFGLDY